MSAISPAERGSGASTSDPAEAARWAGSLLLATFISISITQVGAPIVAGRALSGTNDAAKIAAYYGHHSLEAFFWQSALGWLVFAAFFVAFWRYVRAYVSSPRDGMLLDIAAALALIEIPLLFAEASLQAALVQLARAEPTSAATLIGLFASWDWIYNGLAYWLEFGWLVLFSYVAWRGRAMPPLLAGFGALVGLFQLLNTTVLLIGLPGSVARPGNALFALWLLVVGIYLVRGGAARRTA